MKTLLLFFAVASLSFGQVKIQGTVKVQGLAKAGGVAGGGGGGITFIAAANNLVNSCASNPSVTLSTNLGDTLIIAQDRAGDLTAFVAPTGTGGDTVVAGVAPASNGWVGTWSGRVDVIKQTSANASYVVTGGTGTAGVAGACNLLVVQLRGSPAGTIDQTATNTMGNTANSTSVCVPSSNSNTVCNLTFTPAVTGEASLLFVAGATSAVAGLICGSTATIPTNGQATNGAIEYLLNSGTSPCTAAMSFSGSNNVGMLITIEP